MRNLAFLLLAILGFAACGDDDAQPKDPAATVNLNFRALYNGNPLVLYQPLDYPDGKQIRLQNFNFFVSKIKLLGEGTTPDYQLSGIEFFDFVGNQDATAAEKPLTRNYEKVPLGTYKGISIDFGVPSELNNANSGSLPSDNPLRQHFASHYWSDWDSYIFMKSEGIYDSTGDGVFNQSDIGFEHHPGTNEVLTSVTLLQPIVLTDKLVYDLNLFGDVYEIYVHEGVALDLSDPANKNTQSLSDLPLAKSLMNHWLSALSL
ncbi:MAG: hypothetical protein IT258_17360 [Saprospiraceae bacterium]|nr:hypothetical protein [Saprospiraceae bacterium]